MIPYDIDQSLHGREPQLDRLEDGFSPPEEPHPDAVALPDPQAEPVLGPKSEF